MLIKGKITKIYVTKYALTQGIKEYDVLDGGVHGNSVYFKVNGYTQSYYGNDWHMIRRRLLKGLKMQVNKLKSLEKQIKKIKELNFEV